MSKKRKKKKSNKSRARLNYGPIAIEQGKNIRLRNKADPGQFAAMRQALADWRASVPSEMRCASERILELGKPFDPLAVLGFVFNLHHLAPQLAGKEMSQSYAVIEHLALLLAKQGDHGIEPVVDLDAAKEIVDTLDAQMQAAVQYVLPELPADGSTPPDLEFRDALASILAFEQGVRGERYDHQQKALMRALFQPFSDAIRNALGFTPGEALVLEDAYDERIRDVAMAGQEQVAVVISDFHNIRKNRPVSDERHRLLFEQFDGAHGDFDLQVSLLLWISTRTGHSIAPAVEDLVTETGLAADTVQRILRAFSLDRSGLTDYWQIQAFSPLKNRPLVQFGGSYALPSPSLLLPSLQSLLERTLKSAPQWESYQRHRSAYAVKRGVELFTKALPGAQVYADMKYKGSGFEGDVDILVVFAGHVFLVEVKSGDFAEAARAGVESRVQADLEELVLKAHRQTNRAMDYVESTQVARFQNAAETVEVRRSEHLKFNLVSLTLEQLGHIVNTARTYLQRTSRPAWTVSVDDLETIVDVLTMPAQFIEYVERRKQIINMPIVQSVDELAYLERYVRNGLRLDPSEYDGFDSVLMDASSRTIDAFENAKGRGEEGPPPACKLPKEVAELLCELERQRPTGWLPASLLALGMLPRHQRLLARNIEKLRANKKVTGVVEKSDDGSWRAYLRLDDPRLGKGAGIGPTLVTDAALSALSVQNLER